VALIGVNVITAGIVAVGKSATSVRLRLQAALTIMMNSSNPLKRIRVLLTIN
jgi:hypothetical protein